MRAIIKDLKVVNYVAERYIKDIRECADLAKDSQQREDILIVATKLKGFRTSEMECSLNCNM